MKNFSFFRALLLGLIIIPAVQGMDSSSSPSSETTDVTTYRSNLKNHINEKIARYVQLKQQQVPKNSSLSVALGYGKGKDTSSEAPGSSRSESLTVGVDTSHEKWGFGVSLGETYSVSRSFLTPPGKTSGYSTALQPYLSYQLSPYMNIFGAVGITYSDSHSISQSEVSNAHLISQSYMESIGTLFMLPVVHETILPTFRVSTTRSDSKTNSYIWAGTYNPRTTSHQQTVDPTLRVTFLSLDNFVPYIEYGPHWVVHRSSRSTNEPLKVGQTFAGGGTISLPNDYKIGFSYARDILTTPGYRDYFSVQLSRSF